MTHEQRKPTDPGIEDLFGLTERERLYDRVSNKRLKTFLDDERTIIVDTMLSTNNYGEFVFVKLARSDLPGRQSITFWGLGYHEYRERWITDEWFWYHYNSPEPLAAGKSREEAEEILKQRRDEIAHYGTSDVQSNRGKLFEMIADLTDDDGAIAEMDDLASLFDDDEPF